MKTRKMRIISLALTLLLSISMIAPSAILAPVYAATPAAPAQVKGVKAVATNTSTIKLSWTKIAKNKNTKGYAIYRQGKLLARVSYKTNTYTNTKLKANTRYAYTVRAYNTYKQTQYYNTATKKWQTKKPAKKNWRGKKIRKVTAYKYGKVSATVAATTKKPAAPKVSPTLTTAGSTTMEAGSTYKLNVKSNSTGAFTYKSNNTAVATVTNGVVTAKGVGTATITVSQAAIGNYTAVTKNITLTVVKDLQFRNSTLPTAETYDISKGSVTYTVKSKAGATFTSSNPAVATVSSGIGSIYSNKITFHKAGSTTITVKSKASGETKTIKLTITDKSTNNSNTGNTNNTGNTGSTKPASYSNFAVVESIPTVMNVGMGKQTYTVTLPTNSCNVTWTSSSSSVDVFYYDGKLTLKPLELSIKVQSLNSLN